jgi:hypothetical protein
MSFDRSEICEMRWRTANRKTWCSPQMTLLVRRVRPAPRADDLRTSVTSMNANVPILDGRPLEQRKAPSRRSSVLPGAPFELRIAQSSVASAFTGG